MTAERSQGATPNRRTRQRADYWMERGAADALVRLFGSRRLRPTVTFGSERAPLADVTQAQPLPRPTGHLPVDDVVGALVDVPKRAWIVHRYFVDMGRVLGECARVVRPGGRVVLVVCPSNIRKVPIPTHELFAAWPVQPRVAS